MQSKALFLARSDLYVCVHEVEGSKIGLESTFSHGFTDTARKVDL